MCISVPNIRSKLFLSLPYPHHPLTGRLAFVIERLLFAFRPSTETLAGIGYLSATLSWVLRERADFNRIDMRTAVRFYCEYKA